MVSKHRITEIALKNMINMLICWCCTATKRS